MHSRAAASRLLAGALIIGMVLALVIFDVVVFAPRAPAVNGPSPFATLSGSLTIPSGNGSGTLVVSITNSANSPITQVTASSYVADGAAFTVDGVAAGGGNFLSSAPTPDPLPIGQTTTFTELVKGGQAGTTYTFVVTVAFTKGENQTQTLSLTAGT